MARRPVVSKQVATRAPDPSVRDPWIIEMQNMSALPRALMGGTDAMRAGATKWLPQHPAEADEDYEYRTRTARLRNYFRRTVHIMAGKMFAKPFQVEDPPQIMQDILWDVDRQATDVQAFARDLLVDALGGCGVSWFYVDRDRLVENTAQADQQRRTAPYWVHLPIERLISIRSAVVNGEHVVTHLRFFTETEKIINEFESEFVPQIKVIERDNWRVYEQQTIPRSKRTTWVQVESGENRLGEVALVPMYLNRTGFHMGENPLADLADMNLEHFQLRTEQRRALQVNSFPMLVAINYDGDLADIKVGPNKITGLKGEEKTNVDLKYVESQGKHLDAGRNEINDLVDQMRAFGAQFDKPGEIGTVESASGRVIDAKEATSVLQLWALSMKDSIEVGMYWTDRYLGGNGSLARTGKVDMSLDFTHVLSDKDLELLFKVRQLGDLSRKTLWRVLKQNSVLPEDFNPDDEEEFIGDEPVDELIPPTGPQPKPAPAGG